MYVIDLMLLSKWNLIDISSGIWHFNSHLFYVIFENIIEEQHEQCRSAVGKKYKHVIR
jgi:hypothetical protein